MSAKRKLKTPACVPQSWEDADKLMAEFGVLSGKIVRLQAGCDDAVAKIKATFQIQAAPVQARLDEIFEAVEYYATANRKRLTDDGKSKTVVMTAGLFGWRLCPPSVAFAKGLKAADIVVVIRTARESALCGNLRKAATTLAGFIRVKEEPNKDAMLENTTIAMLVDGVSIVTDKEEFFLDPSTAELPVPK